MLAILTPPVPATVGGVSLRAPMCCILVNAGVIHRVGPHRFNVKLARHLAARGIAGVRLDLSGRGDTPAAHTQASFGDQAVADIRSAMDEMSRAYGCERFVMFGICSGAVNAMDAALADERLVGVCLYDGYAFPTFKTHAIRYWRNIMGRPVRVVFDSLMRHLRARREAVVDGVSATRQTDDRGLGIIAVERFRGVLEQLAGRGVDVKVMYSGSIGGHYNHAGQFDAVFAGADFKGRVSCDYLPHLDHTLTSVAAQHDLQERLAAWCRLVEARHARTPAVRAEPAVPLVEAA